MEAEPTAVELIGRSYAVLSPAHRRVADFILSSPHQSALMTLEDMSRATGVSKATANRLAGRVGIDGWPELKRRLRAELELALSPVDDLAGTVRVHSFSRTAPWAQSLAEDLERIRGIEAVGGEAAFVRACELLASARRVHIVGFGSSAFIAQYAAFCLSSLRDYCSALVSASGIEGAMREVVGSGKEDAALLISFARYSEHSVHLAARLHRQEVPIICIGDAGSPAAALAASCFVVDRKPGFVVSGSGTGAVAVVEALLRGTAARISLDEVQRRSQALTEALGQTVAPAGSLSNAHPAPPRRDGSGG